jgi:hypothetical protein
LYSSSSTFSSSSCRFRHHNLLLSYIFVLIIFSALRPKHLFLLLSRLIFCLFVLISSSIFFSRTD